MRVRLRTKPEITGWSESFNAHGMGEIIVYYDEGDASSEFIADYEVLLEKPLPSSVYKPNVWISLSEALRSHDVINDNYVTRFFEPVNEAEKARGYRL